MKTTQLLAVFCLTCLSAQAQTARPGHAAPRPRVAVRNDGMKDGLTMQKGRVLVTETGITNPLLGDKKLVNGITITPGGRVTGADGIATQMAEGDIVSLTGRVTSRASIMAADSIAKIQLYDAKYPGKRKKAEAERERKSKTEAKLREKREKEAAKKK